MRGLTQSLFLVWKSKARYAITTADAPDHSYIHTNYMDNYPNGLPIPHKLDLKELTRNYARLDVNFYFG